MAKAQINLDAVGGGSITTTTLWENSAPSSAFSETTITVPDISAFDELRVTYRLSTSDSSQHFTSIDVSTFGTGDGRQGFMCWSTSVAVARWMTKNSSTSITISGGYYVGSGGGSDSYTIPLKIEGITY